MGDSWLEKLEDIKNEVHRFFQDHFSSNSSLRRPNLDGIAFNEISAEDNNMLIASVTMEELKNVVWSCDGNKCPGSDGFNFNFIKANWEVLKNELLDFVLEFQKNVCLPKAIKASF